MFFADATRGFSEFWRVLRPSGRVAVCVSTTPDRTVYWRVYELARQHLPPGRSPMAWNFALSHPRHLEAALLGTGFCDVLVTREIRTVSFASLGDYWAAIEAGGGPSGATYLALSPDDRQAVRDRIQRSLLSADSDGPFSVEMEVMLGSGRR